MNPNRGAWLEYETDAANVFYVRIDKNRKLPVTVLCRALGLSSNEDILNYFGEDERILATLEKDTTRTARRACWRSTASCAPASPHGGVRYQPDRYAVLRSAPVRPVPLRPL